MNIPDIPLSHFALQFSADGLVVASRDLCTGAPPAFQTSFTGWNGTSVNATVPSTVEGCSGGGGGGGAKASGKVALKHASSAKPKLSLSLEEKGGKAGTTIKRARLTLPKALRFGPRKAVRKGFEVRGGKLSGAKGRVATIKGTSTKVVAKLSKGALLRTRKVAGKKLRFRVSVTDSAGKTTKLKLTTRARP